MNLELEFAGAYRPLWSDEFRLFLLWGGRDAGRSYTVAHRLIQLASQKRVRIMCVRWTYVRTGGSQRAELINAVSNWRLDDAWTTTKGVDLTCTATGSAIMFGGLSGRRGMRSLADIDVVWCEEAHDYEDPDWLDFADTVIRKPGMLLYMTGNKQYLTDAAYRWTMDHRDLPDCLYLETTYAENRWFSDEARVEMEICRRNDPERYRNEWLGQLRKSSAEINIISWDWLESAIRLYPQYSDRIGAYASNRHFSLDASDGGDDSIIVAGSGPFIEHVENATHPKGRITETIARFHELISAYRGKRAYYDETGIGTNVTSYYAQRQAMPYKIIPVGFGWETLAKDVRYGKQSNGAKFPRRNAQMAWNIRDRLRATWLLEAGEHIDPQHCLFVDPTCCNGQDDAPNERQFFAEMVQPEFTYGPQDQVRMDKAPRGLRSPGIFDGVCLVKHADVEAGLRIRY